MSHSPAIITRKRSGLVLGVHLGEYPSAALVQDGKLIAHIAEERVDYAKTVRPSSISFQAIVSILAQTNHTIRDIDAIGYSFKNCTIERLATRFKEELAFFFEIPTITTIPVSHHVAHAWSACALSGFDRSAVLVCDGTGELVESPFEDSGNVTECRGSSWAREGESLFLSDGDTLELCERRVQSFLPDLYDRPLSYNVSQMPAEYAKQSVSIDRKYEQFTYFVGFGNQQNDKTMGLAAYGQPLVDLREWAVTDFAYKLTLADILREIEQIASAESMPVGRFLRLHRADAASTVQRFTEEALLGLVRYVKKRARMSKLCLSGRIFHNCVVNHKIAQAGLFNDLYIMPACGDEGQALGAAFAASAAMRGRTSKPKRTEAQAIAGTETTKANVRETDLSTAPLLPYVGPSYDRSTIEEAITRNNLRSYWRDDDTLIDEIALFIERGQTVGLLRGRSEVGPHALGHRSILADPRSPTMKDHLNAHVKFREGFRPYGPMVLAEHATEMFDLIQPSPFKQFACDVRTRYRALLPAITHTDGTARVQTIDSEEPFLRALLMAFYRRTGVAVLLNASFNLSGELMVETPEDAIHAFLSSGLDMLVLEGAVIRKSRLRAYQSTGGSQHVIQMA